MQVDDPPYLSVGTAVSAKYKGAFCEAKVSKVVRVVKCKVTYKMGLGTATVSDEQIKGLLRVGQLVQAKHPDRKEYIDATITKIQDCSQYTVVFDDGDITTLRRTALCLKSGRHFNESETLDQLPLTHPEHFGNPVVGGRRGRRSRQAKEDSSEGEGEEENEPDLEVYTIEVGRVVCVEASDKKRSKDNWFPGLVVMPSAQLTVRINVKDEFLVRSFKDGRYYTVPQKEVTEFSRDMVAKIESTLLSEAVEKAVKYLDSDELPLHWERDLLFSNSIQVATSDSDDRYTDSSDDETPEEKDHFVAQLYKFMDDSNTPLNKSPMIGNKDVDLHRLFRIVRKLGGYNRVTNKNKWKSVALRLKLTNNPNNFNQVKLVYKKFLLSFEAFHRTLGVTMLSHPRNAKKSRGRSLIRDKDRSTPVNSPRPDKEDEPGFQEKREEEKPEEKSKIVKKIEPKLKEEEKKPKEVAEVSDTNSSDTTDISEIASNSNTKLKRSDSKSSKDRKVKPPTGEKVKAMVEKLEEQIKIEDKEEEKVQQTRSKNQTLKSKEKEILPEKRLRDTKTPLPEIASTNKTPVKSIKKSEDDKKKGRKRVNNDDKEKTQSDSGTDSSSVPTVNVGDKLKVYYGPTHESKVTYEAKVVEIESSDPLNLMYMVHYTGWNTRYDEWIKPIRIAENLSATTKAKKLRQNSSTVKASVTKTSPNKRGRRMSITGRSTVVDTPRSTTPSSVTSTSSRTKSPATPVTRASRSTRQGGISKRTRRSSVQTDASNHSESDSDGTESDSETVKTRSVGKLEESDELITKRNLKSSVRDKHLREDEETEKEEESAFTEIKPKRNRKLKKITSKASSSVESDDDSGSPPKGRDFDLIQIRSELKGFVKAAAIANAELVDKEAISSDESVNLSDAKIISDIMDTEPEKIKTVLPKSLSSDDIYEFKEPEPFEFETRSKLVDDKTKKRLVPRIFEDTDKPKKKKLMTKAEVKEDLEVEKKRPKQTTNKRSDLNSEEDETSNDSINRSQAEDLFDKLVESPSFHSGREKPLGTTEKPKVVKSLNLDEPLNLFHGLSENNEEDSGDHLDISDTEESQNEPLFTHKEQLFSDSTFGKTSPEQAGLDPIFRGFVPKPIERKNKDSDDDDSIRESIQNVINQTSSSTDDDSNDLLMINPPFINYQESKTQIKPKTPTSTSKEIVSEDNLKIVDMEIEKMEEKIQPIANQDLMKMLPSKDISPALQESDNSLIELISKPPEILTKLEETKDIAIKSSTKIADSLLQKLSMIKSPEEKSMDEEDSGSEDDNKPIIAMKTEIIKQDFVIKKEENIIKTEIVTKSSTDLKLEPKLKPIKSVEKPKTSEVRLKGMDNKTKIGDTKGKFKVEPILESKKRSRKIVTPEFIEDSDTDSDSTDSSERLVIARSDEESQTNSSFDVKLDAKENSDEIVSNTADNSQTSCDSNFKFSDVKDSDASSSLKPEVDLVKEEEPDSHLHSLLLCEETIPGSPAPQPEVSSVSEVRSKPVGVLEMPFASAPGTSNNSNKSESIKDKGINKERNRPPSLGFSAENREKDTQKSTVLDNTPPLTPESTISNLSPRGDIGGLSPNTADDSCKSGEGEPDYNIQRRSSSNKISYSEDGSLDALLNADSSTSNKKMKDLIGASVGRKRRRSCKGTDEVPLKRGRKTINRSRHTSESDDTTFDLPDQSLMSNTSLSGGSVIDSQMARSPKSKYNFMVDLDSIIDSNERIAMLQQKMQDIRATYAVVKNKLVAIERRRKKLRRREREAKLAKQESQNS